MQSNRCFGCFQTNQIFTGTPLRSRSLPSVLEHPFGLGRFATDRYHAPQVNSRYAALLLTNFIFIGLVSWN